MQTGAATRASGRTFYGRSFFQVIIFEIMMPTDMEQIKILQKCCMTVVVK
jgi:hypothetical protein